MKIIIYAIGSRGDVQPYIALALGLKERGHEVVIGTETAHKGLLDASGIEHVPVEGSVEWALANTEAGAKLKVTKNPLKMMPIVKEMFYPLADQWAEGITEHTKNFDFVIFTAVSALFGVYIMRKVYPDKPFVGSFLFPSLPTKEFAPPGLSGDSQSMFKWINNIKWKLADMAAKSVYKDWFGRQRANLGIAPSDEIPWFEAMKIGIETIHGFSPALVPKPADWDVHQHVTGQFVLPVPQDFQPPQQLVDFLQAGSPPVYIGFGSMLGSVMSEEEAIETLKNCLRAVRACQWRAILCIRGYDRLKSIVKNNDGWLYFLDAIPHGWLFPRCRIVVHHGGAGTTHTTLHAGVPAVIVPFGADQPFWGNHLHRLGCGPLPIFYKDLTPPAVHKALLVADTEECRRNVKRISDEMNKEKGVEKAIEVIENVKTPPKWDQLGN